MSSRAVLRDKVAGFWPPLLSGGGLKTDNDGSIHPADTTGEAPSPCCQVRLGLKVVVEYFGIGFEVRDTHGEGFDVSTIIQGFRPQEGPLY